MILSINRNAAYGLILNVIVIVILMFDTALELLLELTHVSFELVEHWLDMLIEHVTPKTVYRHQNHHKREEEA